MHANHSPIVLDLNQIRPRGERVAKVSFPACYAVASSEVAQVLLGPRPARLGRLTSVHISPDAERTELV